jgi:hypothetical protein
LNDGIDRCRFVGIFWQANVMGADCRHIGPSSIFSDGAGPGSRQAQLSTNTNEQYFLIHASDLIASAT